MHTLLLAFYNIIVIPLLFAGFHLAALFNPKIASGVRGRRRLFAHLPEQLSQWTEPRIWFHIASMGEFEQAKPVIAAVKKLQPEVRILVTFFSPSVYDHTKNYPLADMISYLPFDSWRQSRKFISLIRPSAAVVIRHDIWPNYQWRLHQLGIPSFLIDASISDVRVRWFRYMPWLIRDILKTFSEMDATSAEYLPALQQFYPYPQQLLVMGDTRYDQVHSRTQEREKIAELVDSGLFHRPHCFVAGSTWPEDERVILGPLFQLLHDRPEYTLILVPHELTKDHLADLEAKLSEQPFSYIRLSQFSQRPAKGLRVLLVDRMGLLANLYALGELAYVGGGFGPGVHSVLEPAAHGCMVVFGPNHLRSLESLHLQQRKAGFAITSSAEFQPILDQWLETPAVVSKAGAASLQLVQENLGASDRIARRVLDRIK